MGPALCSTIVMVSKLFAAKPLDTKPELFLRAGSKAEEDDRQVKTGL